VHLHGVAIAGAVSVAANLACLHATLSAGLPIHIAWAVAFEVGTLVSFAAHQLITWRARLPASPRALLGRVVRFQMSALLALGVNLAVFAALTHLGVHLLVADVAGIAAGFFFNNTLGLSYTFVR
jgi:putative flippase GtrA